MPFAPTDLAGLHGWWKADSLVLSDNDPVATWADSSGNGFDATQGTADNRPTYKTNIVNSLPVVRFASDSLVTTASASLAAQTLFAVIDPTVAQPESILAAVAGGLQWRINSNKSNILKQSTADIASSTTNVSTTAFQVLAATFANASSYAFYLNGAADGSGSHSVTLDASKLQNIGGPHEGSNADIAEIIIYDSVLSAGDRANVTYYLGTKYGISVPAVGGSDPPPRRRLNYGALLQV